MNPSALVDTDILIDVSRGDAAAVEFLIAMESTGEPAISVVTALEVLAGCRNKRDFSVAERFLGRFRTMALSAEGETEARRLFKRYRLSHGLMIPDCLIAATAMAAGIPLATKNRRDFVFIDGLALLPFGDKS